MKLTTDRAEVRGDVSVLETPHLEQPVTFDLPRAALIGERDGGIVVGHADDGTRKVDVALAEAEGTAT